MGKRDYEALLIIFIILVSMLMGNTVLPSWIGSSNYLYYFKPLFWFVLSIYIWKQPRCRFKGKLKLYRFIVIWSVICGILYISVFFSGGFLDGIGASPYAMDIKGIFSNILCFGSVMVMMEWVRNYIINRVKKKYVFLFSFLIVVVFSLYRLNLRIVLNLASWQQVIQYLGEYVLPEIMSNILLTYLVYIGGAFPAIIYIVLTTFPVWMIPVLPNLKWITKAFIGIIAPAAFLLVIRQVYKKQTREIKLRDQKTENPHAWILTSIFSILLIWFAVGVFPIFPTVILTGSMKPYIDPGDVALMQKSDVKNIKTGDVIQYWTGEIFIIHRIIFIEEKTGKFQTKGDNNSAPDASLVSAEQIKGKVIGVIPKVGILSVIFRTDKQIPKEKVEF